MTPSGRCYQPRIIIWNTLNKYSIVIVINVATICDTPRCFFVQLPSLTPPTAVKLALNCNPINCHLLPPLIIDLETFKIPVAGKDQTIFKLETRYRRWKLSPPQNSISVTWQLQLKRQIRMIKTFDNAVYLPAKFNSSRLPAVKLSMSGPYFRSAHISFAYTYEWSHR